jgi:hypothetical protein
MFNILPPSHDISNLVSSTTVTWYQISYKNHVITFKHVIKSNHVVRIITWFTLKSRDCYEFINKFVLLPPLPPSKNFHPCNVKHIIHLVRPYWIIKKFILFILILSPFIVLELLALGNFWVKVQIYIQKDLANQTSNWPKIGPTKFEQAFYISSHFYFDNWRNRNILTGIPVLNTIGIVFQKTLYDSRTTFGTGPHYN